MKKVNKSLLISSVVLAAFTVILVVALALIVTDTDDAIPNAAKIPLFLCGGIGFIASLPVFIKILVNTLKNQPKKQSAKFSYFPVQKKEDDVKRIPIEIDDEEGQKEYEKYFKCFWDNLKLPDGFLEFLKEYSEDVRELNIILLEKDNRFGYVEGWNTFDLYDVWQPERLREFNENMFLYDDYHNQFRDIVFFSDDGSGHCHFLLDYGKGGEPQIKYMDDELDLVVLIADSFKEFKQKLITAKEANAIIGKDYYL